MSRQDIWSHVEGDWHDFPSEGGDRMNYGQAKTFASHIISVGGFGSGFTEGQFRSAFNSFGGGSVHRGDMPDLIL